MGKNRIGYWEAVIRDTAGEGLLNDLTEAGISFFVPQLVDGVTVYVRGPYGEMTALRRILERRGSELRYCRPYGLVPMALRLGKRYGLLLTLGLCCMLLVLSNLFVWRIEVRGNETVPKGAVLRAMEEAGAGIGSFWPAFDGEQLKTQLLLRLEDVQWVAVNYRSGAVEVVLREKRKVPEVIDNDEPVHIVSDRDGIIGAMGVKQGQSLVAVGDTVEKGQILVRGDVVSAMGTTRTVHALGSVQGRTWHTLSVRIPTEQWKKTYVGHRSLKISLIFGRRRVNFYRNSSIFGDTCDTITMDYHLCMDGIFSLPVRLAVQRCEYWEGVTNDADVNRLTERGQACLKEALSARLGDDGVLVTEQYAAKSGADAVTVTVMAECLEEIGVEVPIPESRLREIRADNTLREEAVND